MKEDIEAGNKLTLMLPRIKVIAEWPDMKCKVGDTISLPSFDWIYCDLTHCDVDFFNTWPHLFRKMAWWEERDRKEIPGYLLLKYTSEIIKIQAWDLSKTLGERIRPAFRRTGSNYWEWITSADFPATETEYLNYINQSK